MRLLLTGAHGFLGQHIKQAIDPSHELFNLGRKKGAIICDLSKEIPPFPGRINKVIHAAGKAHSVPRKHEEAQAFFDVNVKGTEHLLQAMEADPPTQFTFISTVAVYGRESGTAIAEDHPLSGQSPYAQSKIQAEALVQEWGERKGVQILILRLPLIAGPQPPGNLGKMIAAIKKGRYLSIAGGKARRSMVMASDVAQLIAKQDNAAGIYHLTDGYHPSFREIEQVICQQLDKKLPPSLPLPIARVLGRVGDVLPFIPVRSSTIQKMSQDLTFDDSKARRELNWQACRVIDNFDIR